MPFFTVNYTYTDDTARLDEVRPEHREYLGSLVPQGSLRAAGPFVGPDAGASLLVFETDSIAQVRSLIDKDPYQLAGLVADAQIREWNPVLGDYAPAAD